MTNDSRKPKRVQMSRQRPWRSEHPDAVIVDRRTRWGNWWKVRQDSPSTYGLSIYNGEFVRRGMSKPVAIAKAVRWFREDCAEVLRAETDGKFYDALQTLRGRDLACWCPLDQPCHADVLLELAND